MLEIRHAVSNTENGMANDFVEMQVKGLAQIKEALEHKSKEDARRVTKDALEIGGNEFLRAVQQEAPKQTGFLARNFNIKFSFKGSTDTNPLGHAFIGPNGHMDYPKSTGGYTKKGSKKIGRIPVISVARFLEYGTSKMQANPFMSRAFSAAREVVLYRIVAALKQGLGLS